MKETDAFDLLTRVGCSRDVIEHCRTVGEYARNIALGIMACAEKKGTALTIDVDAVFLGGLLHDIGRSKTHGIHHAIAGAAIGHENGLSDTLVKIIERHIGAGIPRDEAAGIGLPEKDYLPVTLEEKIVAHADNLVSGSSVSTLDEQVLNLRKRFVDEKIIQRIIALNNEIRAMMC